MQRAIGISAIGTGEGKTLVALGLARALATRGDRVAPFKVGPDYLDGQLYAHACGRRARNLDLWLDGAARVRDELAQANGRGEFALIEGMMGLFDGDDAGETSTAHVLAANDVPAVLVIDGWRMSQSAVAVALGCAAASPRVQILGVILNRCGGDAHARAVRDACAREGVELLATLPYDPTFVMPERHLGIDVSRLSNLSHALDRVADMLCEQIDFAHRFGPVVAASSTTAAEATGPCIAYADDAALSFTYPQTLEALAALGRLVPFSPLVDRALPDGTQAVWLGGGYPEAHVERLAANEPMRAALRDAVESGVPVYAECGGMMLLARSIETAQGRFPMANALDVDVSIAQPRLTIGYRSLRARDENPLDRAGDAFRGYEFHYASARSNEPAAYDGDGDAGARRGRTLASFVHRRFHRGDRTLCRFIESAH